MHSLREKLTVEIRREGKEDHQKQTREKFVADHVISLIEKTIRMDSGEKDLVLVLEELG